MDPSSGLGSAMSNTASSVSKFASSSSGQQAIIAGSGSALSNITQLLSARNQASAMNQNASLLDNQARQVVNNAGEQANQIRSRGNQVAGEQDAAIAQAGTGWGGSNALVRKSTQVNVAEDANAASRTGALQADQLQTQAASLRAQASGNKVGLLSLLGAGAQVASSGISAYKGLNRK